MPSASGAAALPAASASALPSRCRAVPPERAKEALLGRLLLLLFRASFEELAAVYRFAKGLLGAGTQSGGTDSAPSQVPREAAAEPGAHGSPAYVFRRAGSHWRVVFAGSGEFYLPDTLGTRYLDYMLHHPNQAIAAFDLEVAIQPEKAGARSKDSIQEKLSPEAARRYLRELTRLRAEREEAAETGRLTEADRLDGEIGFIEEALRGGGQSGDAGERARSNVNKALALVRRRLAKGGRAEREFGEHVERFVSIGYQCMYAQPPGGCWD